MIMQLEWCDLMPAGAIMSVDSHLLLLGYGNYQWKTIQELDSTQPAFYCSDFFLRTSTPWLQFERYQRISVDACQLDPCPLTDPPLQWQMIPQEFFCAEFNALQQAFVSTPLRKAVPYLFASCQEQMTFRRLQCALAHALRALQQGFGYLYGFWTSEEGILGLTPELLFRYTPEPYPIIQTAAVAGTCNKHNHLADFTCNQKERQEHSWVIRGIKEALQPYGTVSIQELHILELALLNHLMTPIQVILNRTLSFEEIVRILHPTPALGAFPRQEGWLWLEQYQKKVARGYYGAPIGILDVQHRLYQCIVAIRNIQWNQQGMRIGAGCGIIQDSQWEQEWKEIELKMQAIRQMMHL